HTTEMAETIDSRRAKAAAAFGRGVESDTRPFTRPSLRRLYANVRNAIAMAGLGGDWLSFRKSLRNIRKDSYCIARRGDSEHRRHTCAAGMIIREKGAAMMLEHARAIHP